MACFITTVHPSMKLLLPAVLAVALGILPAAAQTPSENLKPKTPPPSERKATLETPAAPAPSPEDQVMVTENLRGLVFLRSKEDIRREGMESVSGVEVRDIPLISGPDFAQALQPYLGQPARLGTLKAIQREVILFCRAHDRPLVDVIVPNQEVDPTNGVVQVVLIEGRVGKITVQNEGRKWFSDESILRSIRAHPGDAISEKRLLADIDWLNRNPFREVTPGFRQGELAGLSDMQLDVRDRIPVRVFGGYEDSGTEATGEDRLLAGFNWGNAFGQAHQLNYQYSTDAEFDTLTAHSMSYIAPLPWRHTLSVYGTYVDIDTPVDTNFNSTAVNYQAALRYSVPLPIMRDFQQEVFGGFDFKHNETDLLFGGTSVDPTETEVFQLVLGYNGSMNDRWGRTTVGLQGFFSPGDVTDLNDDAAFGSQHAGAEAMYAYGRLTLERVTRLPWNMSWIVRGGGQWASGNLIPSEQLGVGGYNTVRGYDEREANGDHGFVLSTELRSPAYSVFGRIPKWKVADQLQFLAFTDYGMAESVDMAPGEVSSHLWSVGGGFRYTISRYLSFRFDYGVQLRDSEAPVSSDYGSRAHIGIIASY
jgi:hemolysin activation/secretion protein